MSLTATGTAAADGIAPTAQASLRNAGSTDPNGPSDVPGPGRTQPATTTPGEDCEPTPAGSRERKAGAVKACVTTIANPALPAQGKSLAAAPPAAPAAAADTGSCAITTPRGMWYHNRFAYCINGLTVLYTLKDSNDSVVGTGTLDVSSSAVLPAKGTTWIEFVRVTMTRATGAVSSLYLRFKPSCSAGCKVTKSPKWTGRKIVEGQVVFGDVAYESSPAPGTKVDFTTSYELFVWSPGAQIIDPSASWSNPKEIRCDDAVRDMTTGTPDPGCVVPSEMPVVKMSDQPVPAGAGAAAAGYLWAQSNLGAWGRDKPLTRAKGDVAGRTARTCGTFQTRTDLVADDSCGEFPFAVTREGGIDGAQCAEILPRHSTRGGWVTDVLDGGTGSPCARAHVPLADKQAAEAQLAEGFASQRVVEDEQFKVQISGSIAEPQAVCRQNAPAGWVPNGNGWIKNTTDPVPHVNKTDPQSPPGERAAVAQACLGTKPPTGTEAEGNITGWDDADQFRNLHSPGTGLARCHLIANAFGGKGGRNDGNNLVPCWQSGMNTGTPSMRTYEFVVQRAVREISEGGILGPNDAIFYEVAPVYQYADSTIPQGVKMSARVERSDGKSQPLFPDIYVPNTQKNTGQLNLGN
ncbi:DNA/RNA non-specific endonuclease [Streptomyces katrae]|uniref:DNA/RNA non-specific endonuclease n=1 Tax=Streptomyces katrae TaxID=68223 RepID=A0ABT7GP59_9ACTN|nr:DNA/RNA non-specific endonuclease [Streptomyces katrae]MDK9495091.1 DNA/RNA non-specific endonuclease [Streptomyces katrae]